MRAILLCSVIVALMAGCHPRTPGDADAPVVEAPDAATAVHSAVFQAALDEPGLQTYLQLENLGRERIPVIISGDAELLSRLVAHKAGERVVYRPPSAVAGTPHLAFEKFVVRDSSADVSFRYAVEGLRAEYRLVRDSSGWRVKDADHFLE
ncbi:hypothetical protein [Lysobacter panacisoli]|uniref:Lipoprotein n=1 Tax=Lysobacter panacisoli TaxID=1255263 RepID=A0ABP9LUB8_9GAMM|nr:hypothetical protein [Lysobacter panacisoli]